MYALSLTHTSIHIWQNLIILATTHSHALACTRLQEDVATWMKEGQQLRNEKEMKQEAGSDVLNMSIEQLFHVEPSRRGQRRANLFKQRMVYICTRMNVCLLSCASENIPCMHAWPIFVICVVRVRLLVYLLHILSRNRCA